MPPAEQSPERRAIIDFRRSEYLTRAETINALIEQQKNEVIVLPNQQRQQSAGASMVASTAVPPCLSPKNPSSGKPLPHVPSNAQQTAPQSASDNDNAVLEGAKLVSDLNNEYHLVDKCGRAVAVSASTLKVSLSIFL